ncbi:MAG: hypothetical protein HRT38_01405 [Alteromonadaceae bacterium]|nr:hypothetical protein [Alteromonadaceae bacterium]
MAKKVYSDSFYTVQVKVLLDKIYGHSIIKDSVLDRAIAFFENQTKVQQKFEQFNEIKVSLEEKLPNVSSKELVICRQSLKQLELKVAEYQQLLNIEKDKRHQHLLEICCEVVNLTESEDFSECDRKSAQLLGTVQLLGPTQGNKVSDINQLRKPLYKAILCCRLLDKLCIDEIITDPYLNEFLEGIKPGQYQKFGTLKPEQYKHFITMVKIPIVMAAILQDIGYYHPDVQAIVKGENGELDNYCALEVKERKALLQIKYREMIKYVNEGIGERTYKGNSKADREIYNKNELKKTTFIKYLLKCSIAPKSGIGNLLKVPQIYASLILSTKPSYNYKLLPKVYIVLQQNAERGACCKSVVDALHQITGSYPQGFGITYIPTDPNGKLTDRYEYAIVTQLNPPNLDEPLCRSATKNLTYISYGQDITVPLACNLYHFETVNKFSRISKKRLNEILQLLASNYQERKELDLIPRCWRTEDYFSTKVNQKLWDKRKD